MKKSAVEWYIKKIKEARQMCDDTSMEMDIRHTLDVLIGKGEQAKEMEKEQSIKIPPYNLDELALIKYPIHNVSYEGFTIDNNALKRIGFIDGFKEALELVTFKPQ